jgi:hypothetical protein
MVELIRRMGIALGSLVAAALCVGLVGGMIPSFAIASPIGLLLPGPSLGGSALSAIVIVVLGGLIYRDILIREQHRR